MPKQAPKTPTDNPTEQFIHQCVDNYLDKKGVPTPIPALPLTGYIRAKELLQYLPFASSKLWAMANDKSNPFPAPIKIGAMTCWENQAIHKWFDLIKQQATQDEPANDHAYSTAS